LFSWWSWRPGIAPASAVLIGLLLLLLTTLFLTVGLSALISSIFGGVTAQHLNGPATGHAGGSPGTVPGSLLLLLVGLLMLPYPLFLTFGGWHDLRGQRQAVTGRVVTLRTTARDIIRQGRAARPGMTSRLARAWYGMALQPGEPLDPRTHQQIMIFRLNEEQYRDLREGEHVRVVYTPRLRHVQSLKHVDAA
jgi:hypothetical protein